MTALRLGRRGQFLLALTLFLSPFLTLAVRVPGGSLYGPGWQWLALNEGAVDDIAVGTASDGSRWLYALVRGQGIFRQLNGGDWEAVNTGLPQGVLGRVSPHRLALNPAMPQQAWVAVVEAQGGAVYTTMDGGVQWQPLLQMLNGHVQVLQWVPCAAPGCPEGGVLFVATSKIVLWSSNLGLSWHLASSWEDTVNPATASEVASLAVAPNNPDILYLGVVGNFFRSDDRGATWRQANAGLGNLTIRTIVLDPGNAQRAFVGTRNGVFMTTNGGETWRAFGSDFAGQAVHQLLLVIDESGMPLLLVAGLDSNGVWLYPLSPSVAARVGPTALRGAEWHAWQAGMGAVRINSLAITPHNKLLLAGGEETLWAYPLQE